MSEFILLDSAFHEIGSTFFNVDFEIGKESESNNDFKINTNANILKDIDFKGLYIENTELGGMLEYFESTNVTDSQVVKGTTWRGILSRHVVKPPTGEDYKTFTGDVKDIISELLQPVSSLFQTDGQQLGITVTNFQANRYATVLSTIEKLLDQVGYRLDLKAIKQSAGSSIKIIVDAIEKVTLDGIYNSDLYLPMKFVINNMGYNHIIAAGQGQLSQRDIVELFIGENGEVTENQYFTGLQEKTYFYNYTSAESNEELIKSTRKKLLEICDKRTLTLLSNDSANEDIQSLEVGDVIRVVFPDSTEYESEVANKIYKVANGKIETQIKVKEW